MADGLTYKQAGVNIDEGNALIPHIAKLAARTQRPEVKTGVGGFGALFEIPVDRYRRPMLVSGTDGVGTKLRLAIDSGRLSSVGIDLVAMCVNDILTCGAEPLYFLDYYATGKLDIEQAKAVLSGIADGCEQAGAALIGGETAEMPGMYAAGDFDLAGFCVGIVDADAVVDGTQARPGDAIIGLHSSGIHSNGYSLVRHVIDHAGATLNDTVGDTPLVDLLMTPTRIYVKAVKELSARFPVTAMAHITGGGIPENLHRGLPDGLQAEVARGSWPVPTIFEWLEREGSIAQAEMDRTFNCGIGYAVCVPAEAADDAMAHLAASDVSASVIGTLAECPDGPPKVVYTSA